MDITRLILAANDGDREALDELVPLVYEELRWLAHSQLRREFGPRTLSTTALVNEAYLKLAGHPRIPAANALVHRELRTVRPRGGLKATASTLLR